MNLKNRPPFFILKALGQWGSKKRLFVWLISTFILNAANSFAEDTVGYVRLKTTPAEDTLAWDDVNRFSDIPLKEEDAFSGQVDSAAGSTIIVSNSPAWTVDKFKYAQGSQSRTFFVEVISGASVGATFDITENTSNSITVNLGVGNLNSIAQGDDIRIGSYWTLNLLFPDGGTLTPSTAGSDGTAVLFPTSSLDGPAFSGTTSYYYRSDLGHWIDESAPLTDAGDLVIPHDALLVIRQDPAIPISTYFFGFEAPVNQGISATISYDEDVTAPEITVEQPAENNLVDGVSVKNFGEVAVGGNTQLTFTITNDGASALSGLAASVDGTNSGEFVASALSTTSLNAGQSTTLTVTFTPTAATTRTAALHIASDDADENPFDIGLTGTGTAPEIAVENPLNTGLGDGVSPIDFGTPNVGGTTTQTFTIRNAGNSVLNSLAASVDGTNGAEFVAGSIGATALNPGETTTVTVSFTPAAEGGRSAALHLSSNDADENPFDIALTGTGTVPEIVIEQPVNSPLADGAGTVDFGDVTATENSAKTFTIRNTGAGTLSGLALSVDGSNASEFMASGLSATSLASNATATFLVTFTPDAAGNRSAAIHVTSNDSDESPYDIALTGNGLDAEISVEEPVNVGLIDGVSIIDFDETNVGVAVTKTFTIRNVGTEDLTDLVATFSGTNSGDFATAAFGSTTVAAGDSTTVDITFTPLAEGARTATLEIASNDRDENPFQISLTGNGTAPEIAVEHPVNTDLTDGVASIDFGNGNVTQSIVKSFTIRNSGDGPLSGIALQVTGDQQSDFVANNLSSNSVAVGETATFDVTFTPTSSGVRNAAIEITSNDADENPFDIALTGTGLDPEITVAESSSDLTSGSSSLAFGSAEPTQTIEKTFTIRNTGNTDLTDLEATVTGTNDADFVAGALSTTSLAADETATVTVTFTAGDLGARSATLSIASNDRDENPFTITLSGIGIEELPDRIEVPGDSASEPAATTVAFTDEAVGNYAGLVSDAVSDPVGWFSARKIKTSGSFSAKFSVNGVSQSIKGVFDETTGAFSTVVTNKSGNVFTVTMGLEESGAGRQIGGTIDVDGDLFTVRATQSSFHKTKNPAPWAGRYTFLFPSDPNQTDGSIQPLGDGYAKGTISTSGTVKIAGRLGDGTKLSLATVAGADGSLQVFRNLYRTNPKGILGGTLSLRDVDNISEIDGTLKWVKFADTRESRYPTGFDINQSAIGGFYSAPYRNEQILSSLDDSDDNARLTIAKGNVAALPELPFTWTESNKAIYTRLGTEKLSLKFSAKHGTFSGSYVDKTTGHSIKIAGAVLQPQQIAAGYFIGDEQTGYVHISSATSPTIEVKELLTDTTLNDGSATPSIAEGTDFGDAGFEGGSAERSFLITNVGTGDLVLTKTPVITEATPNFAVAAMNGGFLKAGESTLVKLIFQPTAAGTHSADIAIHSNDRTTNPFTFAVQGTGIAGSLTTTAGGEGDFSGDTPTDSAANVATTNALPDVFPKGTYTGIVQENLPGEPTVGYVKLSLSKGGLSAFSANFYHDDGKRYGFKNTFDPANGSTSGDITKATGDLINYALQLGETDATSDLRISGTFFDGDRELTFTLFRTGFDKTNPVDESLQGRYTMLILGNEDLGENYPHGHGAVLVTVGSTGTVKAAGTLGDGKTFSHSGVLSRDLDWQLFKFLYSTKPKGFISGKLTFRDLAGISDFDGNLHWKKRSHSREKYFDRGFDLTAQAIGSKFVAPVSGEFVMPGLVDTLENAEFSTNDAGIVAPAPNVLNFTWSTKHKLAFTRVGTETVKLAVSSKTGALSGSYSDKNNSASAKIKGVVFQKQGITGGVSNSGTTTGSVIISPIAP